MGEYALAIDLGASGGRHILGRMERGRIELTEVYRFQNEMIVRDGFQCWDMEALFDQVLAGMRECADRGMIPATVGIDTWGVDYTLVDAAGRPCGPSVAYRDVRTGAMPALLDTRINPAELYARTGIARQPYNTVYQLMAEARAATGGIPRDARLLFTPCYLSYCLTGIARNEHSIASTSGLLNACTHLWDDDVLEAAGIAGSVLGDPPVQPATVLGPLLPGVARRVGYSCTVVLPASHDTASAYLAAPLSHQGAAVLSSGTWSLLGLERDGPILTEAARRAGFTNETGFGGSTTFVRNITGLWLLQAIRREWNKRLSYAEMSALATAGNDYPHTFDALQERFLSPTSMTGEIAGALTQAGLPLPSSDAQLLYCVHHSLAICYRDAIKQLRALTHSPITSLNIVGGGSQNTTLNQLTADATQLPVYAGPIEATALGNLAAQWIATSELSDLAEARDMITRSSQLAIYHPK